MRLENMMQGLVSMAVIEMKWQQQQHLHDFANFSPSDLVLLCIDQNVLEPAQSVHVLSWHETCRLEKYLFLEKKIFVTKERSAKT
jgi:hypothetical protein